MKTPTHTYRNRPVRIAAAGSTPESVVIELLDSTYIDADTEHYNRTEVYASELTEVTSTYIVKTTTTTGDELTQIYAESFDFVSRDDEHETYTVTTSNAALLEWLLDNDASVYTYHVAPTVCSCGAPISPPCVMCEACAEKHTAAVFDEPTIENEDVWQAVACYEAGYKLTPEQKTILLAAAHDTSRRDVVIMHSLGIITTLQEAWLAKVEGRPVAESLYGQTKKTEKRIEFRSTEKVNTMLGQLVTDGEEKSAVLRCGVELYYRRKYGKALEAK